MKEKNSSKSASVLLSQCGSVDQDSGAGLRSMNIARVLSEGGFRVSLLGLGPSSDGSAKCDRKDVNDIEVWQIGVDSTKAHLLAEYSGSVVKESSRTVRLAGTALIYGRIVKQIQADIVTVISGHPLFQIITFSCLPRNSRLVIDFHDVLSQGSAVMRNWTVNHPIVRGLRALEQYEIMRAKGVLTSGWTMAATLRTELRARNVIAYPNSSLMDLEKMEREASSVENSITRYLEDSNKTKYVYLGRLDPGSRGLEHLVRSMINLTPTLAKKMLFLFIGDGALYDFIRISSAKMNCEVMLTGNVPRREAIAMLRRCDVALLPYPVEALPLLRWALPTKVFEYVYVGLPVVMPDLPDAKLVAGELAFVYYNWVELQRILESFASGRHEPGNLNETRKRLSDEFLNERLNQQLVSFYKSLEAPTQEAESIRLF